MIPLSISFAKLIHADTKTKFVAFLTGSEDLEVNVTVAVEAALFLSLTSLLVILCRWNTLVCFYSGRFA